MLRNAPVASSVVASMPRVLPLTKPASASRCDTHVKTTWCVSKSTRRRVRDTGRMVRRSLVQRDVEKLKQAQRVGRPPRDHLFRVQVFEVAEQQPEVASRRQTRPTHPVRVNFAHCLSTKASKPVRRVHG